MKNLNILWTTDSKSKSNWESEYINNFLFSKFNTTIYDNVIQNNILLDDSLIVYNADKISSSDEIKKYLSNYKGKKYFLLHLSDEWLFNDCEEYRGATVIFRNYINPRIKSNKVLTIPLGWKYGFKDGYKKPINKEKKYISTFVGQPKNDRQAMVEEIKKFKNHFLHLTEAFFSKKALESEQLIEIYRSSEFIPCPMGNSSIDTFRLFEVLESGGLPLLKQYFGKDYYKNLLGENPIPIINNWQEMHVFSENLKKYGVEKKTQEVQEWYNNYKETLLTNIKQKLYNFLE